MKAYILRISSDLSRSYAEQTANSCSKLGIDYEFFEGVENKTAFNAWLESGLDVKMVGLYKSEKIDGSVCATVSHALLWKKLVDQKENAIILEHDALMLHDCNFELPELAIVALGYKLADPSRYDHVKAGKATQLHNIGGHEGAHAYALTWQTAKVLLHDMKKIGVNLPIDNTYFLSMRSTKIPLYIADPTPAIGWIRQSTIWPESAIVNYEFIPSFQANLN